VNACLGGIEKLAPHGFQAESHDLLIRGLCPSCQGRES
jgi:Fe2+ or Zn2+ uptake regulation protein